MDETLFPDMAGLVAAGHACGLTLGWYMNCCGCSKGEHNLTEPHYTQDAEACSCRGVAPHATIPQVKLATGTAPTHPPARAGSGGIWIRRHQGRRLRQRAQHNRLGSRRECHWAPPHARCVAAAASAQCGPGGPEGSSLHTAENCNDNYPFRPPSFDACPYNYYRTSIDNAPPFLSAVSNLLDTAQFLATQARCIALIQLKLLLSASHPSPHTHAHTHAHPTPTPCFQSGPGCFAYADMLEIGAPALGDPSIPNDCPGKARLTVEEAKGSFGAWCAISSPLILSFDVANLTEYDTWWPVVSNTRAIAIHNVRVLVGRLEAVVNPTRGIATDDTYNPPHMCAHRHGTAAPGPSSPSLTRRTLRSRTTAAPARSPTTGTWPACCSSAAARQCGVGCSH